MECATCKYISSLTVTGRCHCKDFCKCDIRGISKDLSPLTVTGRGTCKDLSLLHVTGLGTCKHLSLLTVTGRGTCKDLSPLTVTGRGTCKDLSLLHVTGRGTCKDLSPLTVTGSGTCKDLSLVHVTGRKNEKNSLTRFPERASNYVSCLSELERELPELDKPKMSLRRAILCKCNLGTSHLWKGQSRRGWGLKAGWASGGIRVRR